MNHHIKELFSEKGVNRSVGKITFRAKAKNYCKNESIGNGGNLSFSHVTYCMAPNAGDTVLSQCVRKTIESSIPVSKWNIIPVKNHVSADTITQINSNGPLIIGGGGLFLPDTNNNSISGWQWDISNELLSEISVPIYVYSVGYNYFNGQENDAMFLNSLQALVEKSTFFGLRNSGSVKSIKNLLPQEYEEKITFQPCTTTIIRKIYKDSLPTKEETGSIAVNMAFDRGNLRFGTNREIILSQVASAIKHIESKGYKIYYVCHCWNDDNFLPYLQAENVKYTLVDLSRKFPDDVYTFYNKMDLVLGMRGHAQMIPFGLNCEIISLGTHNKMKWFLEDIDSTDWYIDLTHKYEQLSNIIIDKFEEIHETNRSKTQERLIVSQNKLFEITNNNLTIIKNSLVP